MTTHDTRLLEARLLEAHAAGDGPALVQLYREAADQAADPDAAAFFLTHAWIWALDTGSPDEPVLRQRLSDLGRV